MFSLVFIITCNYELLCFGYLRMSLSYLRAGSCPRSPACCRHVSTVAQGGQTNTLALERAFRVFMAPDGHRSFSYMLGEVFSWLVGWLVGL